MIRALILSCAVWFAGAACFAGVTHSSVRTVHSKKSIVDIVSQLGYGALSDTGEFDLGTLVDRVKPKPGSLVLKIDDKPVPVNMGSVLAARKRVHGFIFNKQPLGNVSYAYDAYLPRRRVHVHRETYIADNYVRLSTGLVGALDQVSAVWLEITATESSSGTVIRGTITAYAPLNYKCWLVRRIAHRRAPAIMAVELAKELAKIEQSGRALAGKGESEILELILTALARVRR